MVVVDQIEERVLGTRFSSEALYAVGGVCESNNRSGSVRSIIVYNKESLKGVLSFVPTLNLEIGKGRNVGG